MTVLELITQAYLAAGIARANQTLSAAMTTNALTSLNMMVDLMNADGAMIYANTSETLTLTNGTASYTWGSTALAPNFTTARPVRLVRSFIRDGGYDYDVEIIGGDQYQGIVAKTTPGRPDYVWLNPTYPNSTVQFYPTPNAAYAWHVDSEKDLAEFSTLSATVLLPGEYNELIVYNLAIRLRRHYNLPPLPELMKLADDATKIVERINSIQKMEPVDLGIPFGGNRLTGKWTINSF